MSEEKPGSHHDHYIRPVISTRMAIAIRAVPARTEMLPWRGSLQAPPTKEITTDSSRAGTGDPRARTACQVILGLNMHPLSLQHQRRLFQRFRERRVRMDDKGEVFG